MMVSKRNLLFHKAMFRFHVKHLGCKGWWLGWMLQNDLSYLDLHTMRKENVSSFKTILPNGSERWCFTMVESETSPKKQTDVFQSHCSYGTPVYNNPHIAGQYNPLYIINNQFFSLLPCLMYDALSDRSLSHEFVLHNIHQAAQFFNISFCHSSNWQPRNNWLVRGFSHLKNISQIGNLPQLGVKKKHIWNHHLEIYSSKTLPALKLTVRPLKSMVGWDPISFWDDLFSGAMWALGSVLSI